MKRPFTITGYVDAESDDHGITILRDEFDDFQFTNGVIVKRIAVGDAVEKIL